MYQCCYLRFECLHNQFCVILYVILIILFGCGSWMGGGGALIGISPRASKWLETALHFKTGGGPPGRPETVQHKSTTHMGSWQRLCRRLVGSCGLHWGSVRWLLWRWGFHRESVSRAHLVAVVSADIQGCCGHHELLIHHLVWQWTESGQLR